MRRLVIATMVFTLTLGPAVTFGADEEASALGAFGPAGSLDQGREEHTATPLADGRVLVVGGSRDGPSRRPATVWDPATATFGPAGSTALGREGHTATLLADGRVLVVGGRSDRGGRPSSEVWDPTTSSFGPAGKLAQGRAGHTATRLADDRVLVVGGSEPGGPDYGTAEVWDPTTASFSPAGSLIEARGLHTATLLSDGRVLVIGGLASGDHLASAEVWDPVTVSFSQAGSLAEARMEHEATLLSDGGVLVTGGLIWKDGYAPLSSTEIWDPETGLFASAALLPERRSSHTATLLPDGRVLIVGGLSGCDDDGCDNFGSSTIWDPATASFIPTGPLIEPRTAHTATPLPDGRVFIAGGWGDEAYLPLVEVWDPTGIAVAWPEEFERFGLPSLFGETTEDGVIVLDDEDFCSYLLGTIWDRGSIILTDLVMAAGDDRQALKKALRSQSQYPPSDESALAACVQALNQFRLPERSLLPLPEWSTEHPVIPKAFEGMLVREATSGGEPLAIAEPEPPSAVALEMQMLLGVRQDLQGTCVPLRKGVPGAALAAVDCRPRDRNVRRVRIYLHDSRRDVLDTYFSRLRAVGIERGSESVGRASCGGPEGPYLGGRQVCFIDDAGQAHYFGVEPPSLFYEIIGRDVEAPGRDDGFEAVPLFAWLGNQDTPGGPTLCCGGVSPEK